MKPRLIRRSCRQIPPEPTDPNHVARRLSRSASDIAAQSTRNGTQATSRPALVLGFEGRLVTVIVIGFCQYKHIPRHDSDLNPRRLPKYRARRMLGLHFRKKTHPSPIPRMGLLGEP